MSTVNPTEQAMPTVADPVEPAPPASTGDAIATSPADPECGDETSHDDASPLVGRPCAGEYSVVDSDDIGETERSADTGVAYRVLVIGVAAVLVVVALVGRRRRRAGVSP